MQDVSEGDGKLMMLKKTIEAMRKTIEAMSNDDGIIGLYDKEEMDEFERSQGLQYAKNEGLEIGRADGIEIGRADGIEIGRADGIKIGKENALLETAKNLLKSGNNIQKISKVTGLSPCVIKSLQVGK